MPRRLPNTDLYFQFLFLYRSRPDHKAVHLSQNWQSLTRQLQLGLLCDLFFSLCLSPFLYFI